MYLCNPLLSFQAKGFHDHAKPASKSTGLSLKRKLHAKRERQHQQQLHQQQQIYHQQQQVNQREFESAVPPPPPPPPPQESARETTLGSAGLSSCLNVSSDEMIQQARPQIEMAAEWDHDNGHGQEDVKDYGS